MRIIGLFSGTYGLASIVGPLLGGIISDAVGWRGVLFYMNLPLGGLALLLRIHPVKLASSRATDG